MEGKADGPTLEFLVEKATGEKREEEGLVGLSVLFKHSFYDFKPDPKTFKRMTEMFIFLFKKEKRLEFKDFALVCLGRMVSFQGYIEDLTSESI